MRLICPNCGAQYEVDDAVIPEQGRDVQCSNCGHTWFQQPAHKDADLADELGEVIEPEAPESPEQPERERQGLDPEVADVLREEAEREALARQAEAEGIETQPDLGIDDAAASRTAAARARMARLRGIDEVQSEEEAALAGTALAGSRKDLLPDVDEIQSSLRSSDEPTPSRQAEPEIEDAEIVEKETPRGRRFAFRLVLILAILAVAVYLLAPVIIDYLPQAEPYLVAYVAWVNEMRVLVNGAVSQGIDKIKELVAGFTG